MGTKLRGAPAPAAIWHDSGGRFGAAAVATGLLPEDRFDRQPIVTDAYVFVAQARIDDRDDLCATLGIGSDERVELADSELLHRAWRRWGIECGRHFSGAFAFAGWWRASGRIEAVVDTVSAVPLFHAVVDGRLLLATQLGALLAFPGRATALDGRLLGLLPAPKVLRGSTAHLGVSTLADGHALIHERGCTRIERWWNPDTRPHLRLADPRDYAEAAREALDRAVVAQLRATTPIAATLSGGLDSTLVTAMAARRIPGLTTYTSVPEPGLAAATREGWDVDDFPFAAIVAAAHHMTHVAVPPGGRSPIDLMPAAHERSHTPVRNSANQLWFSGIAGRMAQSGARVLLIGQRGNGTASIVNDWTTGAARFPLRSWARARISDSLAGRIRGTRQSLIRRFGATLLQPAFVDRHAALLRTFVPATGRVAHLRLAMARTNLISVAPMPQWGVEFRDPYANRHFNELLLTFPPEAFMAGGRKRGLAREMGAGLVPDAVRLRERQGEQVPEIMAIIAHHRAAHEAAIERAAASPMFRETFVLDRVRSMLDQLCAGTSHREHAAALLRVIDVGLFMEGAGV